MQEASGILKQVGLSVVSSNFTHYEKNELSCLVGQLQGLDQGMSDFTVGKARINALVVIL